MIRRRVLGSGNGDLGTAATALDLSRSFALDVTADFTPPFPAQSDARAELAAQFIPAGARVLDLSESAELLPLLSSCCSYQVARTDPLRWRRRLQHGGR